MLYDANGHMLTEVVDGTSITGLYSATGKINVYNATNDSGYLGLHHPCGALNVTVVDGSTSVGRFAPNGSLNVINEPSGVPVGSTHPSGALSISGSFFHPSDLFASSEDGAFYDSSDLTSLYIGRDGTGGNPIIGSVVGLMLDKRLMGGQTAAAFIAAQPELVTNGTFDVDSDFVLGSGFTISGGELVGTAVAAYNSFNQDVGAITDSYYQITFDAVITAGNLSLSLHTTSIHDIIISASGSYTFIKKASGPRLYMRSNNAGTPFTGTIDNLSVKHVPGNHAVAPSDVARPTLQATALTTASTTGGELVTNGGFDADSDWTKGSGWTIGAGVATCDGTNAAEIEQASAIAVGKLVKVQFDITAYTAGSVRVITGGYEDTVVLGSTGTYSVIQTMTAGGTVGIRSGSFNGSIDNVSVQEISLADYLYYLDFDGTDDLMLFDVGLERDDSSIFLGISAGASAAQYGAAILVPNQVIYAVGASNNWSHYATTEGGTSYDLRGTPSVVGLLSDTASSVTGRTNGVEEDITTGAFNGRGSGGSIGSSAVGGLQFGEIQLYGVVFRHDANLTDTEKDQIDIWLATKTGVTL